MHCIAINLYENETFTFENWNIITLLTAIETVLFSLLGYDLMFSIMRDLTGEFDHVDVCQRIYK